VNATGKCIEEWGGDPSLNRFADCSHEARPTSWLSPALASEVMARLMVCCPAR